MVQVRMAKEADIPKIAKLISVLNVDPSHHIGYCGVQFREIEQTLEQDWKEGEDTVPVHHSFVLAFEPNDQDEDSLVAVMGFDIDTEDAIAEVWGPFVQHDKWQQTAQSMWEYWLSSSKKLPIEPIKSYYFFVNKVNVNAATFMEFVKAKRKSSEVILSITRESGLSSAQEWQELPPKFEQEFITLHDQTFPETYYSGAEIVGRIQDHYKHRKVFIYTAQERLAGYIYVEAEPSFGEASIEFFGVHPDFRGRGIGTKLLQIGISWFFSFEPITHITLCVGATNQHALQVYEKAGFTMKHELDFYTLQLTSNDGLPELS